jgi:UDP-N-acetylmuramate--alanine ligase
VPEDNVEVQTALQAGIPVLRREEFLKSFLDGLLTIGVAGTHGKTTTTSMIVWMLHELGLEPGFIVGGQVQDLGVNASAGEGELFVIEADEYDYMFWGLAPTIAVVTNVEHDHPDCFPTPVAFAQAFEGFVDRITSDGTLVACQDELGAAHLLAYAGSKCQHWLSYGIDSKCSDYRAANLNPQPGAGTHFDMLRSGQKVAEISLQVPGEHNVLNALAAMVAADLLNLDLQQAAKTLATFRGAGRRFEILGQVEGVTVIDDYGHHPTEIKATLQAARARYPHGRIRTVWQPHTYSRTLRWLPQFSVAFDGADEVIVCAVYAAREQAPDGFSLSQVAAAIKQPQARAIQHFEDVNKDLMQTLTAGDVLIVFSAGDATQISAGVLEELRSKGPQSTEVEV